MIAEEFLQRAHTQLRLWRYALTERRQRLQLAVAWCLPRWLVSCAALRLLMHGTTGRDGDPPPDEVPFSELMRRWEEPSERPRRLT